MKYKTLVIGNNNLIIDDFFVQMVDDLEVVSCSTRYSDISRHIKYFVPDVFVYCMYNEKEESIRQMVNVKPMLKQSRTPVVIIGSKEDCVEFNRIAVNVSDMDIMRPFTAVSIRDSIVRYMELNYPGRKEEALAEKTKEREAAEAKEVDIDSLKNVLSSLDAALSGTASDEAPSKVEPKTADNNTPIAEPKPEQAPAPEPKPEPRVYTDGRKHILVVDDDPIMLKMVKEQLRDAYDVATAISGKIAMKFLERKKTDLILLDYEMPGETGPDVLEKLRENNFTKDIPVIFLTGVSDKSKIQEAIALKPQGYLLKPIDHDKLMSTINSAIGY
ncbi:MAG: response regulator [Lachnospiraceae bacterium]|nr:response regulator [Lachnospiraceae bacterium]